MENFEIECKLAVNYPAEISAQLEELGATDHGQVHERNWVFDTPDRHYRDNNKLVRLRQDSRGRLTYKGPVVEGNDFRHREEVEVEVGDVETMRLILSRLGLEETWFYEKKRHTWEYRECEVVLDTLPELGDFIEVEGLGDGEISAVLTDLGLEKKNHIKGSYRDIFEEHCRREGSPMRDMSF